MWGLDSYTAASLGAVMKRREFVTLIGSGAASWPFVTYAQSTKRMPKIGVLWHAASAYDEACLDQSEMISA